MTVHPHRKPPVHGQPCVMHGTAAANWLASSRDHPKRENREGEDTQSGEQKGIPHSFSESRAPKQGLSTAAHSSNIGLGQHQATAFFQYVTAAACQLEE
jgi:hypothetical protein